MTDKIRCCRASCDRNVAATKYQILGSHHIPVVAGWKHRLIHHIDLLSNYSGVGTPVFSPVMGTNSTPVMSVRSISPFTLRKSTSTCG